MNRKYAIIVCVIFSMIVGIIFAFLVHGSFAYQDNDNYLLFYDDDMDILDDNIKHYIDKVDDYLIPNSSFNYSDILIENYDFITNFALDYIINNREYYEDKIVILDDYRYYDKHHAIRITNEYIDVAQVYKITNMFFGIKDYVILNDNIKEINNYVCLCDYTPIIFKGIIKNTKIINNDNYLLYIVDYNSGDKYIYTFKKMNNVLKIYNIEVYDEKQ